ncbi:MAG: large conductance mechanosensitive channel protein MscL [Actinobacteria bacterium]|jgi:large conductance mechanosensitive channel|nr:large conductance mechanosensitive channel protein MscL [Actinomycetota bacterium]
MKASIFKGVHMGGFRKFLFRGNLIDLAIAVVIGTAFTKVITATVSDLITPVIGAFGKEPNFETLFFTVNSSKFAYGDFLNNLLAFVIITATIYFVIVLPVVKMTTRLSKPRDPATPMRECPECLSSIPAAASRCMYCTAASAPAQPN